MSVVFLLVTAAYAQDGQLAALHATLIALRSKPAQSAVDTRGATPELTIAKHQLRDWIGSQLGSLKDTGRLRQFQDRINEQLKDVDASGKREDQNLLGVINEVRFNAEAGLLIVTTGFGILCQYDESAYAYKEVDGRWQRVWESEQNDYSEAKYAPQHIDAVHVWQSWKEGQANGPAFIMTLGNEWGCASNWHDVYYRVWRVDSAGPKLLIDGSDFAWLRSQTYIIGSIGRNPIANNAPVDVLIEFTMSSIDVVVHNREAVRHFQIDGDKVQRVDPLALSPRDFVDEWLTHPWEESAAWSSGADLRRFHSKDGVDGEFGITMRCQTRDVWQVELAPFYFFVRWTPPYRFQMIGASASPSPHCVTKDPEADA